MGVAFAILWSSAFSVAKVLVAHIPPFTVSTVRFFIAALIAGCLAVALGQRLPRGWQAWRPIILLGLCQNTLYLGLFFTAMVKIPAGLAAIIASAMPLIVAALAPAIVAEPLRPLKVIGLFVGFAGVIWFMADRIAGGIDGFGILLAIFGVMALAVATLTIKKGDFGTGLLMVVACQMAIGGLGCLPVALLIEDVTAFEINRSVVLAFIYQIVFPGIIATLLWFALVKRISTAGASAFHFLNPIFGVGFAALLLGEEISPWDSLGVLLVAVGIGLVNRDQRRPS